MSTMTGAGAGKMPASGNNIVQILLRYGALLVVDAFALLLFYQLASDGVWELAIFILLVTLFINYVNLRPGLEPLRWISPAIALMLLFVFYPILYTVYVAFTNYGDGHLLTTNQAISRIEQTQFLPEDAISYDYTIYRNDTGEFALWLVDEAGDAFFVTEDDPVTAVTDTDTEPENYQGYTQLPTRERFSVLSDIQNIQFGTDEEAIGVTNRNAAAYEQRYVWNPETRIFTDKETGDIYEADDTYGIFLNREAYDAAFAADNSVSRDDFTLITGYRTVVGTENFTRFLTSPAISGPLVRIFLWTIGFASASVFTTFVLGLGVALLLQTDIPYKRVFRTLLIVPYAIPGLIAVATWKGMLDPNLGVITLLINDMFGPGTAPPFFTDPGWAKFGIIMVNLWLGYPYFMLVCSGALAAIPSDMYEAAEVDGANALQKFTGLTMPMLLIAVGPLLIASFTFNFNNFVIIDVFNKGGPPIPGTPTPAGHTDILISYAFRLAFGTGRGADYGLASAITIVIFVMVAAVTLFQFRFTRQLEELSENV